MIMNIVLILTNGGINDNITIRKVAERFLYHSHRALSLIKNTISNQQMHSYHYLFWILYITISVKLVQHVSIPSWDHRQELL
jgi:hypothetical protein